jgi:hypothetical protein
MDPATRQEHTHQGKYKRVDSEIPAVRMTLLSRWLEAIRAFSVLAGKSGHGLEIRLEARFIENKKAEIFHPTH